MSALEVTADVVIPAGEYTIGIGSDDGGKITIPGVDFEYWSDTMAHSTMTRFALKEPAPRLDGWLFQLDEQLETTITADSLSAVVATASRSP